MTLVQNVFRRISSVPLNVKERKLISEICKEIELYIKENLNKNQSDNKVTSELSNEDSDLIQLIDNLQNKVKED